MSRNKNDWNKVVPGTRSFCGGLVRTSFIDRVMTSDKDTGLDMLMSEYLGHGFGLGHDFGHDFGYGKVNYAERMWLK